MAEPLNPSLPMNDSVLEHYNELLAFVTSRLHSRDQALDIVQESFLRIFSLESSRSLVNPRAFLYRTAINLTIDLYRKHQKEFSRLADLDEAQDCLSMHPGPERILVGKEEIQQLSQAIADLPQKCRRVFLLHKIRGKSHREIAEQLGISHAMVEKHMTKALLRCRQHLEE
ncbi:MAG: RNA polymerase sigma factor [Nitrospirales bacterium]|nr:MAG: RNA polymerase sigma factor [Nitrospirales bacterium]